MRELFATTVLASWRPSTRLSILWRCTACAATALSMGCSFLTASRPVPNEGREVKKPECEVDFTPAIVDTVGVVAGAALVVAVSTHTSETDNYPPEKRSHAFLALSTLGLALLTGSAGYGYYAAAECRARRTDNGEGIIKALGRSPVSSRFHSPIVHTL